MLNKVRKSITPMLETLGEATEYLFTLDPAAAEPMRENIAAFTDAISSAADDPTVASLGKTLIEALPACHTPEGQAALRASSDAFKAAIAALPTTYKAVFLPYYDNTWDALESVYEAFAADPMFETEIVIIPIRRNTATGYVDVYDDYLTPMGIPNTHHSQYSFEDDKPDVVFYTNPYDAVNLPRFQSHNIKPHAGLMVYIPYHLYRHEFLTPGQMKKKIEQYTELPGHDNCDIFAAQGESFYGRFKDVSRNGHKMVVLGNPKTDSLYKRKETGDWPRHPQWEKTISGKKVFLLNTHYSIFLKNDETSPEEYPVPYAVDALFDSIEKNHEAALIWRPHPQTFLLIDSINSRHTRLFRALLKRAERCDRVILDRTPSVISAFMYSDAVISSMSSIIIESLFLNLPVFAFDMHPNESMITSDDVHILADYYKPEYDTVLEKARNIDKDNPCLMDVVSHFGVDRHLNDGENIAERVSAPRITQFVRDILSGAGGESTPRDTYCAQLFAYDSGRCAGAISDAVKKRIMTASTHQAL
ncbi:hypothetical protein LJC32_02235 [Oscillospiraceae bacterium OttesenSCG-928-F05]|nr:hypothetical protein [Oscillospiraceae bacterium OttesenSCG-928-F05]